MNIQFIESVQLLLALWILLPCQYCFNSGKGNFTGFLDHITEFSGKLKFPLASIAACLDRKQITAGFRIGKSVNQSDTILGFFVDNILDRSEIGNQI